MDADEDGAPRKLLERAADAAVAGLSIMPPLALVAAIAAIVELSLARVAWHGLTELIETPELLEMRRLARFPRNLAAVAGLGSLLFALFSFLRFPGYAPVWRRLAVAAFAGIFVPTIAVSALLPVTMIRRKLVVFGLAAANVLVTLLAMTAVRYRPEPALRAAMGLAAATAFLTLTVVGLGQLVEAEGMWESLSVMLNENASSTAQGLLFLRHLGELCWIGTLLAAAVAAVWDRDVRVLRARLIAGLVVAAIAAAGFLELWQVTGHRFRFVLFGSFRLGLFVDDEPEIYVVPLGIALAGALMALFRREPTLRQLGAGMLLWLAAGFGPHSPIQLLYLVLGALLMTRSAQARDPSGAWRRRNPWARWLGPSTPPEPASDPDEPPALPSSAE